MRRLFVIFLVIAFFVVLFTYNSNLRLTDVNGTYAHSLPYTPLAQETNFFIDYEFQTSLGTTEVKSFDFVFIQVNYDFNNDLGPGDFDKPSTIPTGCVFFASKTPLNTGSFYGIEQFDIFVYKGGDINGNQLTASNLIDVKESDFSKPFESGNVYFDGTKIYYPNVSGISFIEEVTIRINAIPQPVFPSSGAGFTEYFVYLVDEVVYLVDVIGAVIQSFGDGF
ncbi:MAG: hypothetical protein IJX51_00960 [Clostridia bacterium]|nr:hypothetical protein [Clostridia bacterium]